MKRGAAVVFVGVYPSAPEEIVGCYALSAFSLKLRDIPARYQRRLARYPDVGVALLGRLAVGVPFRGQHMGEFLLVDALHRLGSVVGNECHRSAGTGCLGWLGDRLYPL